MWRNELQTASREVAAAALNEIVAHQPRIAFGDPALMRFMIRSVSYPDFGADLIRIAHAGYGSLTPATDVLIAGVLAGGAGELSYRGHQVALGRDDGLLGPVGVPFRAEFRNPSMVMVRLPLAYTAELSEALTGLPAAGLRFDGVTAVSETMRRYWAGTAAYVSKQLVNAEEDLPALVVEQLRRLAASALLASFPNTTMTAARLPATGEVAPAVVRRAVAYIEDKADQPLTVTEIAAAAGVGARALQVAFRRHLETTPMAYLRRVRQEYAHRDLRAADAAEGVTVASVARRWGFSDLDRFAARYRETYGESPSRTLRT